MIDARCAPLILSLLLNACSVNDTVKDGGGVDSAVQDAGLPDVGVPDASGDGAAPDAEAGCPPCVVGVSSIGTCCLQ